MHSTGTRSSSTGPTGGAGSITRPDCFQGWPDPKSGHPCLTFGPASHCLLDGTGSFSFAFPKARLFHDVLAVQRRMSSMLLISYFLISSSSSETVNKRPVAESMS